MLKIKFLKLLDYILSKKNLKAEEKRHIEAIKKDETQLPENISTDLLIKKLDLITIKGITDEEGYFKEFINTIKNSKQESQTEIFYLLKEKQVSCLHKLKSTETWEWLGGEDLLIYIFEKDKISEVVLNTNNTICEIPVNTLFGAKLISNSDKNFSLVTCRCVPGFLPEYYQNPTSEELNYFFKVYPNYKNIITELMPETILKTSKKTNNIIQPIFQFFTCCIGMKKNKEEQIPLIDSSKNNR